MAHETDKFRVNLMFYHFTNILFPQVRVLNHMFTKPLQHVSQAVYEMVQNISPYNKKECVNTKQ